MMVAQAQQAPLTQQHFYAHKLSIEQVDGIRADWATGDYTQAQLARKNKVTRSCINQIVNNKRRISTRTYKREMSLLDKQEHTYVYGETGEQIAVLDTEDAKQARIEILIAERREHEKRIREINNEIAALEGIPF